MNPVASACFIRMLETLALHTIKVIRHGCPVLIVLHVITRVCQARLHAVSPTKWIKQVINPYGTFGIIQKSALNLLIRMLAMTSSEV